MERFSIIKVLGIGCAVGGALVMVEVESFGKSPMGPTSSVVCWFASASVLTEHLSSFSPDVSGDTMTGNLLVLVRAALNAHHLEMIQVLTWWCPTSFIIGCR
jgi:hypothetical protein